MDFKVIEEGYEEDIFSIGISTSDTHTWLMVPNYLIDDVKGSIQGVDRRNHKCPTCGREIYAAGKSAECVECNNFEYLNALFSTDEYGKDEDYDGLSYPSYLKSVHWQSIRDEKIRQAQGKCSCCGSTLLLHVHHREYPQKRLEIKPFMLVVLCKRCHSRLHD